MKQIIDVESMNINQWKEWFWSDYNKKCKTCYNKCKQSWKVDLLNCFEFKKIEV
jgi:hypothetical protein